MQPVRSGGGWQAIAYTWAKAREVGPWRLWRAMRSKNACKTCALGMGGQAGGMVNEQGHFPEVCKKSLQAMVADMQGAIAPEFFARYSLPELQRLTPRELETCGRLAHPLILPPGSRHYQPLDWDAALDHIAAKLRLTAPDDTFWYFSGRSSNEAAFLLQLLARRYGTNNVSNCSYYCHQASGVALNQALGTGTATITLDDLEHTELVVLIGGNPASNHPRLMRTLMTVRRRGGDVLVVNPVIEPGLVNFSVPSDVRSLLWGSPIASDYVQPVIGGDLALLTGVAKRLVELAATDESFLQAHTDGWPQLKQHLASRSWEVITAASGVPYDVIDRLARRYARARSAVFAWTMGITHHEHGVENVQAIIQLALMRGMVGKPHSGLLPIRGHSNVQGIGSVGVVPQLKPAIRQNIEQYFGIQLPTSAGMDTVQSLEAAFDGRIRLAVSVGGNLFGATPDAAFAAQALARIDQVVYLTTTLNTGHVLGLGRETLILPVLARDEEPQSTTQESMFNFLRLSDGGPRRHPGPRAESEILTQLASRVLPHESTINWPELADHQRVRQAIAAIIPGYAASADIGRNKRELQLAGRTFHEARFGTPDGRARLVTHDSLAPPHDTSGLNPSLTPLRLMTVRSEGQFNTVVYEDYDLYRGQDRRDVILLHPSDLASRGLQPDQPLVVTSRVGHLAPILARPFEGIKPGCALMYYPEANVLVPRTVDPASRTPAFKNVLVTVEVFAPAPAASAVAPGSFVPLHALSTTDGHHAHVHAAANGAAHSTAAHTGSASDGQSLAAGTLAAAIAPAFSRTPVTPRSAKQAKRPAAC